MQTSDAIRMRNWDHQTPVLRPEPIRPQAVAVPLLPVDQITAEVTSPATKGGMLVQRPVNYALDFLPTILGSRVIPAYKNWAEPAVKKVDDTLFAAAGTGARLVGDAKQRFFPAKTPSEASKPGLLTRGLLAAERVVQRALPLQSDEKTAADEMLEGDASVFQRVAHLIITVKHRAVVHMEVKYITTKVKAKVWYDLNLKPPAEAVCTKTMTLRNYVFAQVLTVRDRTQAFTSSVSRSVILQSNKARDFGTRRVEAIKSICDKSYERTATTTRAFSNSMTVKVVGLKDAVSTKTAPLVERVQLLLKPLTDRLTAMLKIFSEQRQKALAKAMAKKAAIAGKARSTTESAQVYVAAKKTAIAGKARATTESAQVYVASIKAEAKRAAVKVLSPNRKAQ